MTKFSINSLQHIGVPVTDMKRSADFYKRLGFENVMQTAFSYRSGTCTVIMMQLGQIIIELYRLPGQDLDAIRSRADGHIDHIAFDVTGVDEVFREMKEKGFEVIEEAPVFLNFWGKGCRFFNIKGPDGERLEFNEILR